MIGKDGQLSGSDEESRKAETIEAYVEIRNDSIGWARLADFVDILMKLNLYTPTSSATMGALGRDADAVGDIANDADHFMVKVPVLQYPDALSLAVTQVNLQSRQNQMTFAQDQAERALVAIKNHKDSLIVHFAKNDFFTLEGGLTENDVPELAQKYVERMITWLSSITA